MWKKTNNNPYGRITGDCAVRAIAMAFGISWLEAYRLLAKEGELQGALPDEVETIDAVIMQKGWRVFAFDGKSVTVAKFAESNPKGKFLAILKGHAVTIIDGDYYDRWDSGKQKIVHYYADEKSAKIRHAF